MSVPAALAYCHMSIQLIACITRPCQFEQLILYSSYSILTPSSAVLNISEVDRGLGVLHALIPVLTAPSWYHVD